MAALGNADGLRSFETFYNRLTDGGISAMKWWMRVILVFECEVACLDTIVGSSISRDIFGLPRLKQLKCETCHS